MEQPMLYRRLEQAKHRNEALKTLLEAVQRNINAMRRSVKSAKDTELDQNNGANLKKQLHKTELDNEKLTQRLNETVAENNKLKELVNGARNERIIHSGIFKNMEKEIRVHETIYKQLLVQGRIEQINAEKMVEYYSKQKSLLARRIEAAKKTPKQPPSRCNESNLGAQQLYTTRKKPRTAFLKKKDEKKDNDRNAEALKQLQAKHEQLLASLKALGVKELSQIDLEVEEINYDIEQLYEGNCELNSEIQVLESQLDQKMHSSGLKAQDSNDPADANSEKTRQVHLQEMLAADLAEIGTLEQRLQQVGTKLGATASSQEQLCRQIEQLLAERLPTVANTAVASISDEQDECADTLPTTYQQAKQNRLNLLLSKSRQVRQIDQILSKTQFKRVFRQIQSKPTAHLRE